MSDPDGFLAVTQEVLNQPRHRWTAKGSELVPYVFTTIEQLLKDFFEAVDSHLPPELLSG